MCVLGHFRSRDNDGGHIILSAISENPTHHANFTALSSIEPKSLPVKVLHFALLLLWRWPWPHDLHIQTWFASLQFVPNDQNELSPSSYHITYLQTYKMPQRTLSRRFAVWKKTWKPSPLPELHRPCLCYMPTLRQWNCPRCRNTIIAPHIHT